MKAAVRERYGSLDVVELRDIDRPVPAGDQVLVRIEAASVNRADLDGIVPKPAFARLFMGLRAPRNPRIGLDAAGVVESVGPGVTRFAPGDRVFADLFPFGQGAFAEYACARERAFARCRRTCRSTSPRRSRTRRSSRCRASGFATAGPSRPGSRVLIDGASGNVGPFAIQIAKSRGAEVTGVCSPAKIDFVRSLGADHVLDYTTVDYTQTGERYDWIVDTDSHHPISRVRRALRPDGVYVTLGGTGSTILQAMVVGAGGIARLAPPDGPAAVVEALPRRATSPRCWTSSPAARSRPPIDRRYPLAEIVDALRYVDDGHARGKVVVEP